MANLPEHDDDIVYVTIVWRGRKFGASFVRALYDPTQIGSMVTNRLVEIQMQENPWKVEWVDDVEVNDGEH